MTRKWRWVAIGVLAVVVACVVLVVSAMLYEDRPGVTMANYNRIAVGMSRAEVEKLLGRPANVAPLDILMPGTECWQGENLDITVHFGGEHELVAEKNCSTQDRTWLEKLRLWFSF